MAETKGQEPLDKLAQLVRKGRLAPQDLPALRVRQVVERPTSGFARPHIVH